MKKPILILVAKHVGLECLKALIPVLNKRQQNFNILYDGDQNKEIETFLNSQELPTHQQEKLTQASLEKIILSDENFSWILNLYSPHYLPPNLLVKAEKRMNLHPALVPLCRGNDNAAWTIKNQCKAGVSLIEMTNTYDDGDIWMQKEVHYEMPITGKNLNLILQKELIQLFTQNFENIIFNDVHPEPQKGEVSSYKRIQTNKDRQIDIENFSEHHDLLKILAHDFHPSSTAVLFYKKKKYKVTLNLELVRDEFEK